MIKGLLTSLIITGALWFGINVLFVPYTPFWAIVVIFACVLSGKTGGS